jgi:hypothetical protein
MDIEHPDHPKILLYCPLHPVHPIVFGRTLESIFRLNWDVPMDIVFGRADHGPVDRETAYNEVLAKYQEARWMALVGGYDAMFTVESDMIVPPLALQRLTRIPADVAYGLYCSRHGQHRWLAFEEVNSRKGTYISDDYEKRAEYWGKVGRTAGVGLGCTLIWRNVLEKVNFRRVKEGAANDWYLAMDCEAHGFMQAHDFGVRCGHITLNPSPRIVWPVVDDGQGNPYEYEFLTLRIDGEDEED